MTRKWRVRTDSAIETLHERLTHSDARWEQISEDAEAARAHDTTIHALAARLEELEASDTHAELGRVRSQVEQMSTDLRSLFETVAGSLETDAAQTEQFDAVRSQANRVDAELRRLEINLACRIDQVRAEIAEARDADLNLLDFGTIDLRLVSDDDGHVSSAG